MEPVFKSEEQLTADGISVLKALSGITDFNPGSVAATFVELHSSEIFQLYVQLLNVIRNFNIDTTTGSDLDARVFDIGMEREAAKKATGKITILRSADFEKVSTTLYTGLPAPVSNDTVLRVNDASNALFGTSGTLIVGRGTANEEEVTYAAGPVDNTNYWEFTVSPFANDHGLDETVILKQGNDETIDAGTIVTVPASANSAEINFSINNDVILQAGEDKIDNVDVTAVEAGVRKGNIPVNAINGEGAFLSPPFAGARAQNSSRFNTGRDRETDDELRDRYKDAIQSLSRGVKTAILNAIVGLVDPVTAKRVVSANVVLPTTLDEFVRIYIDDGTGFEPSFVKQGFETILTSANGGEEILNLDNFPLVKAQLETNVQEPFNMSAGSLTLIYTVGIQSETITFQISDFAFPTAATAEEIVKAINDKATLISARTSEVGKGVVIEARGEENDNIQVTGGTANGILNFPTDERNTLSLYIDDQLFSKDGTTAVIDSVAGPYDFAALGGGSWPLNIIVDGKSANTQTVTFVTADFANPNAATAAEVIDVINEQLAGAEAITISNGLEVRITSNTIKSSKSKLQVTGGSANTVLGFSTSEIQGRDKDYTLNRFLGQIEFSSPLLANQSATTGSRYTRAYLRSTSPETYAITSGQTLVVAVDGGSDQTITFPSTGAFTAAQVIDFINEQLNGATAISRSIGGQVFVELNTNTQEEALGSIEIKSSSTAAGIPFEYDTVVSNQRPHRAFVISGNAEPFAFAVNDQLIVVVDKDPTTKTFTIVMDFDGTVTNGISTTIFRASAFSTIFDSDDELNDFYAVMLSGANTTTGDVETVTNQGGGTFRYAFSTLPVDLSDFAIGDHITFSGMQNIENDGSFIITAISVAGNGYVEVTNTSGVAESGSAGAAAIGQRRLVDDYVASTGQLVLSSPLANTPSVSDTFAILPSTAVNLQAYMGNTTITTLPTKAKTEAVDDATRLQISSLSDGSDGSIQVTGGRANQKLGFSTTVQTGLEAYNYYTGLVKLVHRTIYGDDSDPVAYPGVGAAGIQFDIKAPTVEEISVEIDLTLAEGVSISNVRDDVLSAITGYINGLGVGEEVIRAEIINAIMDVSNVIDVEVSSPAGNIIIDEGELARTRDSLITIG